MLNTGVKYTNFKKKSIIPKVLKNFQSIVKENNEVINSLGKFYNNSFNKKKLKNFLINQILGLLVWEGLHWAPRPYMIF